MQPDILAIDFGTSNSAAAVLENGVPRRLPIQPGSDTLPTAVFFPAEAGAMRIGDAAGAALIAGEPGRYMRALKSVLGNSLLHEPRMIGGRRQTLADVIAIFLRTLRERAEAVTGARYRRALSGRPVHFHTADPARDARAEADLRACYQAAGFEEVAFLAEPEAAALACRELGVGGGAGLVVDIGGGTSDFTAFVVEGGEVRVLASHGIRLGGTDFDQAVSMTHAMPLLGLGGELRREMGPGLLPVPTALYADLATWAKIPFVYAPAPRREAALMARLAVDPLRMNRLVRVLNEELGHELAFAVERGKIAANDGAAAAGIAMEFIERGLSAPIPPSALDAGLHRFGADLRQAATTTLALAGLDATEVANVILVGGSSLMRLVTDMARDLCPGARLQRSEAFTAVVDGLALATAGLGGGTSAMNRPSTPDATPQTVEVDGVPIRFVRFGRGRPVCLIHGASGNLNDMTFRLGPALADRYEVIAVDRPGLGRSGLPAGGNVSINAQASLLRRAIALIGIDRPLVVGHSFGGSVALAWAVDAPETLSALVLLASPSQGWRGGVGLTNTLLARPLLGPPLAHAIPHLVTAGLADRTLAGVFAPQAPPAGYLGHLDLALLLRPSSLRENARQLLALKQELRPMIPAYPRLPMPIEVVHGDADPTVGLEIHSRPFARQVPHARLTVLPGIGHMLHQIATPQVAARIDAVGS